MARHPIFMSAISLVGGTWFLVEAGRFVLRGDLSIGLLTGAAGIGLLVLAWRDFDRLRRP